MGAAASLQPAANAELDGTKPSPGGVVVPLCPLGDDAALVRALRANRPEAAALFFKRHAAMVERVIGHILGFDAEAADVLQEVFGAALTSLHGLKDPALLKPWLSSVAANTARKVLRRRARQRWLRRFIDPSEERRLEPVVPAVDLEARRALRAVYATLSHMPSDERIAFALRFIDGMELSDVAATCRVSLATIKRRLVRAERRFYAHARREPDLAQWLT
jgi:RNA polymerase sigma-70 factor, ECF subfamily